MVHHLCIMYRNLHLRRLSCSLHIIVGLSTKCRRYQGRAYHWCHLITGAFNLKVTIGSTFSHHPLTYHASKTLQVQTISISLIEILHHFMHRAAVEYQNNFPIRRLSSMDRISRTNPASQVLKDPITFNRNSVLEELLVEDKRLVCWGPRSNVASGIKVN